MENRESNARWAIFARKIAEGVNATDAYLASGYTSTTRESAYRSASRLRARPNVATMIREHRALFDFHARQDARLRIRHKLEFLEAIIETGAGSVTGDHRIVQYHRVFKDGTTATRLPCKLKALKMHSQLAGDFDSDPEDTPEPRDTLQELFDEIRSGRRANRVERRMEGLAPDIDHSPANDPQGTLSGCQIRSGRHRQPLSAPSPASTSHTHEPPQKTHNPPQQNSTPPNRPAPTSIPGRAGLSEPADESLDAPTEPTTPETRAHAKEPTPAPPPHSAIRAPKSALVLFRKSLNQTLQSSPPSPFPYDGPLPDEEHPRVKVIRD